MIYNSQFTEKKNFLGRIYLANLKTGEVIDINETTQSVIHEVQGGADDIESLLPALSKAYGCSPQEIRSDVEEIINILIEMNVLIAE